MDDKFSNELSNAELERLAVLSEELGEAQQCIGKIIRHGYESGSPLVDYISNRALLERELGDIQAGVGMMVHAGDVSESEIEHRIGVKIVSIQRWLHHQSEYRGHAEGEMTALVAPPALRLGKRERKRMSEYLSPGSRLRKMACIAFGHSWVTGRGFLYRDESIDLKWKGCRRCFTWEVEGGPGQIEAEFEAVDRAALRP